MGTATMVWDNISGVGEMTAPITKDITNTTLRLELKKDELIIPSFAKTKITSGNSKINPNGKRNEMTNDKYSPSENSGCNSAVAKPIKNLIPAGNTKKYEKVNPIKNKITEVGTSITEANRSFVVNAGTIKAHN
jgi:hypothetical protein